MKAEPVPPEPTAAPQGEPPVEHDLRPLTGEEYFRRAIGGEHRPAVYGKYQASHPVTIRRVYEEALIRFPEAADVLAALVFFNAVDRNREDFLQQIETEKAADR